MGVVIYNIFNMIKGDFEGLPPEMRDMVIKRMSVPTFLSFVQTRSEYAEMAFDEYYWEHFTRRDYPYQEFLPFFATSWRTFYLACKHLECYLPHTFDDVKNGALLCISFWRHFFYLTQHLEFDEVFVRDNPDVMQILGDMFGANADNTHWAVPFLTLSHMYFHRGRLNDGDVMVELLVNRVRNQTFQQAFEKSMINILHVIDDPERVTQLLLKVFLKHLNTPNVFTRWNLASHTRSKVPLKCSFLTLVMFEQEAKDDFNDMLSRGILEIAEDPERRKFVLRRRRDAYFYFQAIAAPWDDIVSLFNLFSTESLTRDKDTGKLLLCKSPVSNWIWP